MKKIIVFILVIFLFLFNTTDDEILYSEKSIKEDKPSDVINYGQIEIKKIGLNTRFIDNDKIDKNVIVIKPVMYPNELGSMLILAGHSGYGPTAFFKNLYKLRLYDEIIIRYQDISYRYKIIDINYQNKTGKIKLKKYKNTNILVLITCTKNNKKMQTIYVASLVH